MQLLRFHDPRMGKEVQCSAGKLFYAGRCWWVGAQGLPSAQYARTRHSATTLSQTLARRKSEIEIFGRRWNIGCRGARGCEVEGEDTMQLGDISVMAWTKRCYLHTR